eukprot:CAMPEP_0115128268 /NCGR_PEP_ID=MMETSP0227-20121206/51001_1 /TAXON_ID=89957 /ORGANISM="Polarella glacialis, Strain CCMP 1383" /LENGTH=615 /DNA_ID=CAMNT_0002532727 /DNA_START=35 /DNA_END=1882 /DNA_ORIENTATION=+
MNALSAPVGLAPVGLRRLPGHVSSRADDPGAQTGPRGVFQAVIPRPASRAKLSECAALCLAGALALQARQISRRQRRMAKSRHRAARVLRQEGASDHDGTLEPGNSALPEEWMQQTDFWNGLWGGPEDRWDDIIEEAGVGDVLAKKKVTVMISDTGGGHRASAKAIADALHELYPDQIEVSIRDVWTDDCPWPFNSVVQQYMWMAKHTWSWRLTWYWSKFPISRWFAQRFANYRCKRAFRRAIEDDNPDLVISVHPATQHIVVKVLKKMARSTRRRIPFVTVVTDLGSAHPMWFHPEADRVFVPSEAVRQIALGCGVRESAIHMYGLPLRRAFWAPETRSRETLRQELGLVPQAATVLVVGGGDGVGQIQRVAEAMAKEMGNAARDAPDGLQVVVICGKNEKVKRQLAASKWPAGVHAHIVGFVSNIDEYMAAADVIVTKAGPGTIAEACTRQLPVMLSSYLPGQERGNVNFVVDPEVIAKTVCGWLRDPEELQRRSKLAGALGRPNATMQIARVIGRKWLVTDTGKLASALVQKLQHSATLVATRSADSALPEGCSTEASCGAEELQTALRTLKEAQQSLISAQTTLRDAKIKVRNMLSEVASAEDITQPDDLS